MKKDVPKLFEKKERCCGCAACYSICPNTAISMYSDDEGFEYPLIDEKKCVRCNKCIRVCPFKLSMDKNGLINYSKYE